MLRFRDRSRVPHNGFRYVQPETKAEFVGHSLGKVVHSVKLHRQANNLPIPADLTGEIEHAMCLERPHLCDDYGAPPLAQQAANFINSIWRWGKSGFALVDQATFDHRVAICQSCPHWKGWGKIGVGRCKLCGCVAGSKSLKLWMATEKCPDNPPRW